MINKKKIVALIPERYGSKGLKNKNILNLKGNPLIHYPITAAKDSLYVDRIIVSTDSEKIADIAKTHGAEVPFLRPLNLASDTTTSSEVIIHMLETLNTELADFEYLILLEPTSPLTTGNDIDRALIELDSNNKFTALTSVAKIESNHPEYCLSINDNKIQPYKGKFPGKAMRRQEIEDLYFLDGSLYLSRIKNFIKTKSFYHEKTLPFIVPYWKSFEIDTYLDLICIEAIMNNIDEIQVKND
jgi:CMP-N,N'-diacetyllegionaminic acid synthase